MKVLTMVTAGALCLMTTAGAAYAGDVQPAPSAQLSQPVVPVAAQTQQIRDTSVGGVPMSKTQAGDRTLYATPCTTGISCNIYHGH